MMCIVSIDRKINYTGTVSDSIVVCIFLKTIELNPEVQPSLINTGDKEINVGNESIKDYSYNWPYDFFSIVEMAKIDCSIEFSEDEQPRTPPETGRGDTNR